MFFFIYIAIFIFSSVTMREITEEKKESLPNILVIITDDQGYHDVSYYGTKDIHTPHIDAIASDGIRMDGFYANSTVCSPTRASLLSGTYPDFVGVPGVIRTFPEDNWGYLNPTVKLLPHYLKKAGYHTGIIGKWHLGLSSPNLPNDKGFDYFHGWLGDMMDDYWTHRRHGINYMRKNEEVIDPKGHATDLFTDWSVQYIRDRAKSRKPFFLYLAYNAPHFPVQPPPDWLEKVKKRAPQLNEKRANLIAFIEHLDHRIGAVIQTLKDQGIYDNTLIIFTSDNGGNLPDLANNGPFRDGKQSMYEGGLRVPTCISWPLKIKKGSSSTTNWLTMDIFPTLLEVAGIQQEATLEGKSMLGALKNNIPFEDHSRTFYFSRREGGTDYHGSCSYALRYGDWKLISNKPGLPMELYHITSDPFEKMNVIHENPDVTRDLSKRLRAYIQKAGKIPWQKP
jgi:arylsulfatase A-like enzyme